MYNFFDKKTKQYFYGWLEQVKLVEILCDKFVFTKLYEMARSRDDAKRLVTGLSPVIFEHFIKLFIFQIPDAKQHWMKELNNYFWQIDKIVLKPSGRKIDQYTLYNWIVHDASPNYTSGWISHEVSLMSRRDYRGVSVSDYDPNHLLNLILGIIKNIGMDIEKNKFIRIEDYLP